MNSADDLTLWDDLCSTEQQVLARILRDWHMISGKDRVISRALETPHHRGTALRLLLLLSNETKTKVFATLVDLASVGHSDIALCRTVIKSMEHEWVVRNIESIGQRILDRNNDEEEYRRLAELYRELDSGLLERHVKAALAHTNEEIREVGSDFQKYL